MEKFSQYRDRGTQIAPYLPIHPPRPAWQLPIAAVLFAIRLPIAFSLLISYFAVIQWLPLPIVRKACLWSVLVSVGLWMIDLGVEGVRKGNLAKESNKRLPSPNSVLLSNHTSPIDVLYLTALFDPVFSAAYPSTELVQPISTLSALLSPFRTPVLSPAKDTKLYTVAELQALYPGRILAIFPECTTSNGRGVLRLSPVVDSLPSQTPIFPLSVRYNPADITVPIPGKSSALRFLFNLLGRWTHGIRVRIGEKIILEEGEHGRNVEEEVGEGMARLGRVRRLDLGVREKRSFAVAWRKNSKRMSLGMRTKPERGSRDD